MPDGDDERRRLERQRRREAASQAAEQARLQRAAEKAAADQERKALVDELGEYGARRRDLEEHLGLPPGSFDEIESLVRRQRMQ